MSVPRERRLLVNRGFPAIWTLPQIRFIPRVSARRAAIASWTGADQDVDGVFSASRALHFQGISHDAVIIAN